MSSLDGNTGSKKRARPRNEDDSPAPTSTKKQRLKVTDNNSASGSSPKVDDDLNPASPPPNGDVNSGRPARPARARRPTQKILEVKGSVDDGQANLGASAKTTQLPRSKLQLPPPPPRARKVPAATGNSSIYDVPDSGDELSTAAGTPVLLSPRKKGATPTLEAQANGADQPVKRKRGRPRKDQSALLNGTQSAAASPAPPTSSKPTSARRPAVPGKGGDQQESEEVPGTPSRKAAAGIRGGRKDLVEQVPNGILTPSKQRAGAGGRERKNVAFRSSMHDSGDNNEHAGEVSFPDLVPKTTKQQPPETSHNEGEGESDDSSEDDQVCAICSKPDTKRGNEIVFCDGCDMAVHQKCYNLPRILPEGDWFCRTCSGDDDSNNLAAGDQKEGGVVVALAEESYLDIPNFEQHLRAMQRVLVDRCTGRRRIKLRGQDEVYEKAFQLVEQTIKAGEGNSMLVIGARGCGKTTLVESVVSDVAKQHKDQFHVVRLNGFVHTDDRLALREIWRQLGKEMEVEDDLINKTNSYADTMASLLALLSHPTEIGAAGGVEQNDGVTSKSVIFVIDEFDLFATHARQTLLYNLFDIAQAKKAPIAVLGLTTRIDVVESLEKRVKSRFSHRYVYLGLPKSLPGYWNVCRQGLRVDDGDMRAEGIDQTVKGHGQFWKWWNEKIETLRKTPVFQDHLEYHFYNSKSVSAFLTTCILPLAALTAAAPTLKVPSYSSSVVPVDPPDSKLHLLESLSDLDLSMLIAAARLDIVAHTDTVNFAMAYDEYASLMSRQRLQSASAGMLALGGGVGRVWGRGVAGIAWERLVTLGLLVPAAPGGRLGSGGQPGGGLDAKMWKVDVALEEIPGAVKLNNVLGKWCREI